MPGQTAPTMVSRSQWASSNILTPEGYPLSMETMPWWRSIYDRSHKNWHHSLVVSGRQVGKSTGGAVNVSIDVRRPGTVVIYAMPTDGHVAELSKMKFDPMWKSIQADMPRMTTNNVHEKIFDNNSAIFFKYLYGGRAASRARGTTASALYLDEIQDIVADEIPVIQETLSFRHYEGQVKWQYFSGTHKSRLSSPAVYWESSSKREWFLKCQSCKHWNYPSVEIIGPTGLICEKCGAGLIPQAGRWVRTGDKSATWEGYRIPQILSPFVSFDVTQADSINDKMAKYSKQKFYNEVMCLPYDSGVLWMTPRQLAEASTDRVAYIDVIGSTGGFSGAFFVGIDWGSAESEGQSDTVVTVIEMKGGVFNIRHIKRFSAGDGDFDYQLDEIARIVDRVKAKSVCADWGFGAYQNQRLKKMLSCPVLQVQYTKQGAFYRYDQKALRWMVDRTQALERLKMDIVESGIVKFPPVEKIKHVEKHFYALERVEDTSKGSVSYEHDSNNPDDAVHSLFYALFAGKKYSWV